MPLGPALTDGCLDFARHERKKGNSGFRPEAVIVSPSSSEEGFGVVKRHCAEPEATTLLRLIPALPGQVSLPLLSRGGENHGSSPLQSRRCRDHCSLHTTPHRSLLSSPTNPSPLGFEKKQMTRAREF